jgi:hypothetical protein
VTGIFSLSAASLLRFYDNIRAMVDAERGRDPKLVSSATVRERAKALQDEITRRGLSYTPIEWSND